MVGGLRATETSSLLK